MTFDPNHYQDLRQMVKKARSSFFWSMHLMGKEKRYAMFALYAYCRTLDDIADSDDPQHIKLSQLHKWYSLSVDHPVIHGLQYAKHRFSLPETELQKLTQGMVMDIQNPLYGPSIQELREYCRLVAGSVGILSTHIFGDISPKAQKFALHLGEALQLTNILRDVSQDKQMGRLYIPREILNQHGILEDNINHPHLPQALETVRSMAQNQYSHAFALFKELQNHKLLPAFFMMRKYAKLLKKLSFQSSQMT